MSRFAQFGNDLYSGKRSIDFVGRQKLFYLISVVLIALAAVGLFGRHLNLGLEFRGGSEFQVSAVKDTSGFDAKAKTAVRNLDSGADVVVTKLGDNSIRVQTDKFDQGAVDGAKTALARAFDVPASAVSSSTVGPSWGASVSQKALQALITFLVLVSLVLALYFRTWKMSLAALVALLHDLIITVGIYALAGFEVTSASVIGFLTILGYSLYDTVVVFDKVRENTRAAQNNGRQSFSQAANTAVNQTLVRSINTSVVALLPVASILFIGFFLLGPGTLLDLALALFVGIAVGTYSSIFIATPVLADLREREPAMKALKKRAEKFQATHPREPVTQAAVAAMPQPGDEQDSPAEASQPRPQGAAATASGNASGNGQHGEQPADHVSVGATSRPLHPYVQTGPRNQPKRPPKSKR